MSAPPARPGSCVGCDGSPVWVGPTPLGMSAADVYGGPLGGRCPPPASGLAPSLAYTCRHIAPSSAVWAVTRPHEAAGWGRLPYQSLMRKRFADTVVHTDGHSARRRALSAR
jgi:hypothetical protein